MSEILIGFDPAYKKDLSCLTIVQKDDNGTLLVKGTFLGKPAEVINELVTEKDKEIERLKAELLKHCNCEFNIDFE